MVIGPNGTLKGSSIQAEYLNFISSIILVSNNNNVVDKTHQLHSINAIRMYMTHIKWSIKCILSGMSLCYAELIMHYISFMERIK